MERKKRLLEEFIREAYRTHAPDKEIFSSCLGFDKEYILKSGGTKLTLRPNQECDSLFNLIVNEKE